MIFRISSEEQKRIDDWLKEDVYPKAVEKQKKRYGDNAEHFIRSCWEIGYPYEGAIGGGLTFEFTPTSLGTVFKAKYLEEVLDLTDYDSW